jgi:hypothetical protein
VAVREGDREDEDVRGEFVCHRHEDMPPGPLGIVDFGIQTRVISDVVFQLWLGFRGRGVRLSLVRPKR